MITTYYGQDKSDSAEEFLKDFSDEMALIRAQNPLYNDTE